MAAPQNGIVQNGVVQSKAPLERPQGDILAAIQKWRCMVRVVQGYHDQQKMDVKLASLPQGGRLRQATHLSACRRVW
jgi:hypothetical protein